MYEVDFLPVEAEGGPSSKSGDAIALRFTRATDGSLLVVVIDAGFAAVGRDVVNHILEYYGTRRVDLVISTHPDTDHLNGLQTVVEQLDVQELWVHQPWLHTESLRDFTNLEAVQSLVAAAASRGVPVSEPFAGLSRFEQQILVLGPTRGLYEDRLEAQLAAERTGLATRYRITRALAAAASASRDLLARALAWYPAETLGEDGETSPRNETSVVTLVTVDGDHLLFTGDAGLIGLPQAADFYETRFGRFQDQPLALFQIPHHGSRRNLSPSLLDRMIGTTAVPFGDTAAIASSAKADPKHPSPKVMNALGRRSARTLATEGKGICNFEGAPSRPGWGPVTPIGPLAEDEDD